mmetsp:Transcript_1955/g.5394  ORF Transcript_1955/g.5394 Transcript_1955/m.5394 type:complete len:215 (-) Transcript_1955:368-1012(-)
MMTRAVVAMQRLEDQVNDGNARKCAQQRIHICTFDDFIALRFEARAMDPHGCQNIWYAPASFRASGRGPSSLLVHVRCKHDTRHPHYSLSLLKSMACMSQIPRILPTINQNKSVTSKSLSNMILLCGASCFCLRSPKFPPLCSRRILRIARRNSHVLGVCTCIVGTNNSVGALLDMSLLARICLLVQCLLEDCLLLQGRFQLLSHLCHLLFLLF